MHRRNSMRLRAALLAVALGGIGIGAVTTASAASAAVVTATHVGSSVPLTLHRLTSATPHISGTAAVGRKLTVSAGKWTAKTTLSYRWYASGKAIAGGTKTSFTLGAAQKGKKITVKVTGKRSGYATVTRTSAATRAVAAGTLTAAAPTITGTAAVGSRLTAKTGTWTSGTKLSYQWYASGSSISGATGSSYGPTGSMVGKTITVKVSGSKSGYTSTSRTSKATALVQTWADKTYGSFPAITLSGYGDDVVSLPSGAKAGIVTADHSGSRNFIVWTLDGGNTDNELLVNEIGRYHGAATFGLNSWDRGVGRALDITADGAWTITISPVASAPALGTSGSGDGVFQYSSTTAGNLAFTHDGTSNFIVEYYRADDWDLLVNEIGSYSGRRPLAAGPGIIQITADGAWTVTR